MSDRLKNLILSLCPQDGSTVGNSSMMRRLRDSIPELSEADYTTARDELVAAGVIRRGKGRGGSIALIDDGQNRGNGYAERGFGESGSPRRAGTADRPKASGAQSEPSQILSYRHDETRVNNPEVGMVHAGTDPDSKKTEWVYDPHLDPVLNFDSAREGIENLIDDALASDDRERMREALHELKRLQAPYLSWTGKAERTSFEVDTVSLHVHERVDPATILASASKRLKGKDAENHWRQSDLFAAPFENLPLRQALDFYHHERGWSNRLVAGDSLLVMNSLLTKESMGGKVQMIYIDPPYGIRYGSNFQPFTNKRDVKDRSDDDLTQEPEMIKAFRDTWELGIHSYLTHLRDRLILARELLAESGSVFVQISEENVHLVRMLLDEIFGRDNFFADIIFVKAGALGAAQLPRRTDYIIWYAKDRTKTKYRQLFIEKNTESDVGAYRRVEEPSGKVRPLQPEDDLSRVRALQYVLMTKPGPGQKYEYSYQGRNISSGGRWWGFPPESMQRLVKSGRVAPSGKESKRYLHDFPASHLSNLWVDTGTGSGMGKIYVVQTNDKVIERCMLMTTDPGDLVFDPTCGSGTTAFAAEKYGRRWITCDTSRVAITLAKQRMLTGTFDYYALRYPKDGLKSGFDYQTISRITLKNIANNPDIDGIYEEDHPKIAKALHDLNAALVGCELRVKSPQGGRSGQLIDFAASGQTHRLQTGERVPADALLEWEVPFDWPEEWPEAARRPFEAFHAARQSMQRRIGQSITDHAGQETLYDKPRIDKTKLRICGPFSVEAVPAPTVLSLDATAPPQESDETVARSGETSRQALWRDELLKTGVRGKGGAMLRFAEFETLPGLKYIHASGSLAQTGERVVVSFGPEHAAMEQRQVEMALDEAQSLRPSPKFILFCAFTFDPEAAKDIDEVTWPGVTLLKAQMNTDLLTEDLKKKRSLNQSFWLMGQPDVELRTRDDGLLEVEVSGFDYFDPKTGDLISGGKRQIAMWELDTDYDNRSLMPDQVFFPMADGKGGWNRLRNTIRTELDEDLLEQFHGTASLPFEPGENRRIAVKIVDDRGIESLKIMQLGE